MTTYRHATAAIGTVLAFHAAGVFSLYEAWRPYDIPMHYGGGLAMGVLALAIWDSAIKKVTFKMESAWAERVFMALCVLGFVALVGIAWEWFEFGFDLYFQTKLGWGLAQTSLGDTMADFFFDLLGSATVLLLRRKA